MDKGFLQVLRSVRDACGAEHTLSSRGPVLHRITSGGGDSPPARSAVHFCSPFLVSVLSTACDLTAELLSCLDQRGAAQEVFRPQTCDRRPMFSVLSPLISKLWRLKGWVLEACTPQGSPAGNLGVMPVPPSGACCRLRRELGCSPSTVPESREALREW